MKVFNTEGKLIEVDIFFEKKATKGRAKKVLTEDALKLIENMARIMCTEDEIATCLGTTTTTLHNDDNDELFKNAIKKGQANGHQSLRRKQYEVAMKGNTSMLIWLGKQYLHQTDKVEQTTSFEDLTPLAELLRKKGE